MNLTSINELAQQIDPLDTAKPLRGVLFPDLVGSVLANQNISTTLFWGPHPQHQQARKADQKTLQAIHGVISATAPGRKVQLNLILADTHGEHNGIPLTQSRPYLQSVAEMGKSTLGNSFNPLWLSDLYQDYRLQIDPEHLLAHGLANGDLLADTELEAALMRGAANRGGGREAALKYLGMRLQEGPMLSELIPQTNGLLLAIGGPEYSPMFARMVERGTLLSRAKADSGAKFINKAPWIL